MSWQFSTVLTVRGSQLFSHTLLSSLEAHGVKSKIRLEGEFVMILFERLEDSLNVTVKKENTHQNFRSKLQLTYNEFIFLITYKTHCLALQLNQIPCEQLKCWTHVLKYHLILEAGKKMLD